MSRNSAGRRLSACLIAVAIQGCGGGSASDPAAGDPAAAPPPPVAAPPAAVSPPAPAPAPSASPSIRIEETIAVGGRERRYLLNLPPAWTDRPQSPVPLIIALHGGGGSGAQFESTNGLTPKADAAGFAVLYPDGTAATAPGLRTWNGGGCCGYAVTAQVDDVEFIRQVTASLVARYRIDPDRIHATGHSNGAIMSYRLACQLSDRIASILANAGALMVDTCAPARPVPILHLHSKLDTNVPYAGGVGTGLSDVPFPPLSQSIDRWVAIDGCTAGPERTDVPGRYTFERWIGCRAGASVQYYLTDDGGHAWPGGEPGRSGSDSPSTAIDANDLAIEFFRANPRP